MNISDPPRVYSIGPGALVGLEPEEQARRIISTGRALKKPCAQINRKLDDYNLSQYSINPGEYLNTSELIRDYVLNDHAALQAITRGRQFGKTAALTAAYGATPGQINRICGSTERLATPEERVQAAQDTVRRAQEAEAAALAAKVEADERKALQDRIYGEKRLAHATLNLLQAVQSMALEGSGFVAPSGTLADFRTELQPLARSYGYKIQFVGNRKQATLVAL